MIVADLFCGAGGSSTGLLMSFPTAELIAVNHWELAIATHSKNHPKAQHYPCDLENVDPNQVVPDGKLDLLIASPVCTYFSRARGGKPTSKQGRATIKYVLRWIAKLDIERVLIENVPEFRDWGPLNPTTMKPIKERKGEYFHRFVAKLRKLGYYVDWKVLVAANYGDPTTRERFFLQARKDRQPTWPEPTHSKNGERDLFGTKQKWVPVRDVIDWSLKGKSIYDRKKPLSPNTIRRIEKGLRKCSGLPFVLGQQSCAAPRTVDSPLPTISTAGSIALIEPFVFQAAYDGNPRSVSEPMPTITSRDAWSLVQPFLVMLYGTSDTRSIDLPAPTITAQGEHIALAEPFIVEYHSNGNAESVNDPLPTITTRDRFGLAQPVIRHEGKTYVMDILYRMLQPHELAGAMSFPKNYQFSGNREQKVKQIGNAVPVLTAAALCKEILA